MWNGGTEAAEGWEGYDGDGAKNDMPPKKLYVPKTAPEISHILKKLYVPKQRPDFSPLHPQKNMCIPI